STTMLSTMARMMLRLFSIILVSVGRGRKWGARHSIWAYVRAGSAHPDRQPAWQRVRSALPVVRPAHSHGEGQSHAHMLSQPREDDVLCDCAVGNCRSSW